MYQVIRVQGREDRVAPQNSARGKFKNANEGLKVMWISIQTPLMCDMFLICRQFPSFKDNLDDTKGRADRRADKGGEERSAGRRSSSRRVSHMLERRRTPARGWCGLIGFIPP